MEFLQKIEEMSKKYGTRTAFHSNFGSISYEELWHQSGRIAQALEEELGDDKHPVVVYGHKRPEMLVGRGAKNGCNRRLWRALRR